MSAAVSDRSGVLAGGNVVNESGEDQGRLPEHAVARQGEEVVAAGRGAIEKLKDKRKPVPYNVYFIGDPRNADLTLEEFPSLPGFEQE